MKRALFFESSFWSRLAEPPESPKRILTEAFLSVVRLRFRVLVSPLVAAELARTPERAKRDDLLDRLWEARPEVVSFGAWAQRMAWELLAAGRWSQRRFADMVHVAYTLMAGADALVTWDKDDLARERTRVVVHAYATRKGIRAPLIGTPEEVAEWLGIKIR